MTVKTPKKTVFDISAGRKYQKPNLSSRTGGGYVENMEKPHGMRILLRGEAAEHGRHWHCFGMPLRRD